MVGSTWLKFMLLCAHGVQGLGVWDFVVGVGFMCIPFHSGVLILPFNTIPLCNTFKLSILVLLDIPLRRDFEPRSCLYRLYTVKLSLSLFPLLYTPVVIQIQGRPVPKTRWLDVTCNSITISTHLPMDSACPPSALIARLPYLTCANVSAAA